MAAGDSLKITFDDRDKHVHWDLKVTDKDGNSLEWYDLNLIEIDEVTLHWTQRRAKAGPTLNNAPLIYQRLRPLPPASAGCLNTFSPKLRDSSRPFF